MKLFPSSVLIISAQLWLVAAVNAQSASISTAQNEKAIELSPFVISDSAETGWVATETVAGSRLRTDYKDVANQIETLTKSFMEDMGLTNLDDALIYTANAENSNEFVPTTIGDQVNFPAEAGRIRSLGSGTLTRDFFVTEVSPDSYNTDRVTIASGPNAILFGLGSPSGTLDSSPARAQLRRNRFGFSLRFDSENSKRATFDANVVAIPDVLAFRVMGLSKSEYTFKKPNTNRDDRLYGTLTFKPFKNTTLSIKGETIDRTWNRASRTTPVDFISPWLNAGGIAGSGYANRPVYDNSSLTGIATNKIFTQQTTNPVLIDGGDGVLRSWRNSVSVRSPGQMPGVDPTFDSANVYTLLDSSIFPFDVNLLGDTRANEIGGKILTATFDQKLADNLFLEVAYNKEHSHNKQLALGGNASGGNFPLYVDANKFIPGTTTPNPHLGEYYLQGTSASRIQDFVRDEWRATLSYEIDLAKKLADRGRWTKWLGRHRLAGLYTQSWDEDTGQANYERRILDNPVLPGVTLRAKTFQNWATDPTRLPQFRHYFTDPYGVNNSQGPLSDSWSVKDANGNPYELYAFSTPLVSANGKRLAAGAAPTGTKGESDAVVLVWQGYFLPDKLHRDRLVVTYGWRKDSARNAGWDAASRAQDFSGLFPILADATFEDFGERETGINRNVGVVARPVSWLSLSYNQSTTFDLNDGRFDPFGNDVPGTSGDGRDYGVRVDLLNNKLSFRVNKYENTLGPQRAANQINAYRATVQNIERRVRELNPSVPLINVTDGNMNGYYERAASTYIMASDFYGEGYEAEINYSPTPNWNIRLNGSKSTSVESNIALEWFDWIDQRLPVWKGVVATNGEVDAANKPVTWATAPYSVNSPAGQTIAEYYESALVGKGLAFIKAVDGRTNPSVKSGRVNGIVNYKFTEGRLKGFNLGGAVRWRGAPIIGYGVSTNASGTTVLNLDQAYKGKEECIFDFVAGYRGKMKAFGGVNYRIQLNIRNLLNDDDVVPTGALTTGVIYQIATVEPRVSSLTFSVEF